MRLAVFVLSFFLFHSNSLADTKAREIIKIGEQAMRGQTTQGHLHMQIVREDFSRGLDLRTWTKGRDNALVEILTPARETGIASLRNSNSMWNYLPNTDQVVRIPSSMMLQSWMGSDFTNDDLVKASSILHDYSHQIVRHLKGNNQRVVIIECKPKPNAPVVWGRILYWARLTDSLPLKQEYFDENNALIRTVWFTEFKNMDDRVIPTRLTVKVAGAEKEFTTVKYKKILYDRKLDPRTFSRHTLKRTTTQGKNLSLGWSMTPLHGRPTLLASRASLKRAKSGFIREKRFAQK